MLPSASHSQSVSQNDHSGLVNELGLCAWNYNQDLFVNEPAHTLSTEVNMLTNKLKEVENYLQSVPEEVMSHGHHPEISGSQDYTHSYVAPYPQHSGKQQIISID